MSCSLPKSVRVPHTSAAKARGKRLGRAADPANAIKRMRVVSKAQAAQFAANVLPIIRDIQSAGHASLNAIAGQLNARKVTAASRSSFED